MTKINILRKEETAEGWEFLVEVKDEKGMAQYSVSAASEYIEKLASGATLEELVKRSFEFLLEREPKESILSEFSLRDIQKYFPEYERTIRQSFS